MPESQMVAGERVPIFASATRRMRVIVLDVAPPRPATEEPISPEPPPRRPLAELEEELAVYGAVTTGSAARRIEHSALVPLMPTELTGAQRRRAGQHLSWLVDPRVGESCSPPLPPNMTTWPRSVSKTMRFSVRGVGELKGSCLVQLVPFHSQVSFRVLWVLLNPPKSTATLRRLS